jgi:hypothetical protein
MAILSLLKGEMSQDGQKQVGAKNVHGLDGFDADFGAVAGRFTDAFVSLKLESGALRGDCSERSLQIG